MKNTLGYFVIDFVLIKIGFVIFVTLNNDIR